MTAVQIQDYIDTYIRKNGRKDIGGDHMNYALSSIMELITSSEDTNVGNSDQVITDVTRKIKLSGGGSGYYLSIRDYLDTKNIFKVDGTGKTTVGSLTVDHTGLYPSIDFKNIANHFAQIQMYYNAFYFTFGSSGVCHMMNYIGMRINGGSTGPANPLTVHGQGSTYASKITDIQEYSTNDELFSVRGNGVLTAPKLPTSDSGLLSGDIWNDSGTLKIV